MAALTDTAEACRLSRSAVTKQAVRCLQNQILQRVQLDVPCSWVAWVLVSPPFASSLQYELGRALGAIVSLFHICRREPTAASV